MTVSNDAIYTGEIDWNAIYRKFYPLGEITKNIRLHLTDLASPAIFSGFGEVGCNLSRDLSLTFVEYSTYMADDARREFQDLKTIVEADILDYLRNDPAPIVMILCRITAYWQSSESLNKFFHAIGAFRRKLVLVDFFDAAAIRKKMRFTTTPNMDRIGTWDITECTEVAKSGPSITIAKLQGAYRDGEDVLRFDTERACYYRDEVLSAARAALPNYTSKITEPIIPNDPGFLLVMQLE